MRRVCVIFSLAFLIILLTLFPDSMLVQATDSVWTIQTVDQENVVLSPSLVLDSSGEPHIIYYDYSSNYLKYAIWNGSGWKTQIVDSGGGESLSIALDSKGNAHISYKNTVGLNYASWTGTAWSIQTVDSNDDVGYYTSLALDSNGNPHISYYDHLNEDLKYATWAGSSWEIQTVDSSDNVGYSPSLALDSAGNPHISYCDPANFSLKYAYIASSSVSWQWLIVGVIAVSGIAIVIASILVMRFVKKKPEQTASSQVSVKRGKRRISGLSFL